MAGIRGNKSISVQTSFNRSGMIKAKDDAKVVFANRAGAYTRRIAQNLIKTTRQTSKPGSPPNSPTKRLKNSVRFSVAGGSKPDAIIGPVRLESNNREVKTGGKPISQILESGGQIQIRRGKRWVKVKVLARPFMRVALRLVVPKLAGMWRGIIKKGQ